MNGARPAATATDRGLLADRLTAALWAVRAVHDPLGRLRENDPDYGGEDGADIYAHLATARRALSAAQAISRDLHGTGADNEEN